MPRANIWLSACTALLLVAAPVVAQDEGSGYILELNDAVAVDAGCRLTYVVQNRLGQPVDRSAFEMAMFNAEGRIASISVFEFGGIPSGRTKVVQFDLADFPCDGLSRILVNGLDQCQSDGADTEICFGQLVTRNLTDIAFE